MSDNLPPSEPPPPPPPEFPPPIPVSGRKRFWQLAGLGALIFVLSIPLGFVNPLLSLFAFGGAFVTLFVRGYRGVFIGYLICMGVALLSAIIYCSTQPLDIR